MVSVGKPLVTSRYMGTELKSVSVLNEGRTVMDLNRRFSESVNKNSSRRRKSLSKSRRPAKY